MRSHTYSRHPFLYPVIILLAAASVLVAFLQRPVSAASTRKEAILLDIDGAIGPATSGYIERGLHGAARSHAQLVILRMDTPGGLSLSMRKIIKAILASPVPVTTFVAPSGSRAASAGTYIMYASHIAAMAPATNIGAATPVQLMGSEKAPAKKKSGKAKNKGAKPQTAEQRKVLNDAIAYIRGLAEKRHRNAAWAEKAVRDAASIPSTVALKKNVIDLIAKDIPTLLKKINGRTVESAAGKVTLHTTGMGIRSVAPDWREHLLGILTNPSLAYFLMLFGIGGLFLEALHPGGVLPGVVGAICFLLALFAFQMLPVNYAGLGLILLGVVLMVAEAFVPSFGSLGFGGIAAFVIGSVILMNTRAPGFGVPMPAVAGVSFAASAILLWVAVMAVRMRRKPSPSSSAGVIGKIAQAKESFSERGTVKVLGETWTARTSQAVQKDGKLKVVGIEGLVLLVEPVIQSEREND